MIYCKFDSCCVIVTIGLEISGTFTRRNGQLIMDMTLSNKAMAPMTGFAIQLNKNSFGLIPAQPLNVPLPLQPSYPQVRTCMNITVD